MGLRALIGVEGADGRYKARPVHYDGCPDVIVPALSHLVFQVCGGDDQIAVEELLGCAWERIHLHTGTANRPAKITLVPSPNLATYPAATAAIGDGQVWDREWAYLFGGRRLHVYLGVDLLKGGQVWEPWACWPITDLPSLPRSEVLEVQKRGYQRQREQSADAQYAAIVAERYGIPRAEIANIWEELDADEVSLLGLDPHGGPYYLSDLTGGDRAALREARMRGTW